MFLRIAPCLLLLTAAVCAQGEATSPQSQKALFGIDKLWDLHIVVPNDGWSSMYPKAGKRYDARFPYAKAQVRIAGHDEIVVGLRFKGNSTYWKLPQSILKRSLKLDFDRYQKGQTFLGLKKLSLNNNYYDTTQVREAISFKAYRKAGVPASRTAFARVFLTIEGSEGEGRIENEYLGLYTLVEQVDRGLLKRKTGAKGALLKPEKQFLPYLGDKWDKRYEKVYGARTNVSAKAGRAIVGLAKVMRDYQRGWKDSDGQKDFQTRLQKVLDVDEFLHYLAVTVLIGNGDSPLLFPHNYYLAVSARSHHVLMLPWDLNNSIGGMGQFMGTNFVELSIYQPTTVPLIVQVLKVPEFKKRYTEIIRELIQGPCSARRMTAAYQVARKTVASAIADEAKRSKIVTNFGGSGGSGKGKGKSHGRKPTPADLDRFFVAREKSVLDQLAGRSRGVSLKGGQKGRGKGKGGGKGKGMGKGGGKQFDAKAYLAGARKKFKAMVESGEMTAEEAEARIAELKKKIGGSSKGSNKKGRGRSKKDAKKKG